jgi:hypothetical protein
MYELSSPPITLAVLRYIHTCCNECVWAHLLLLAAY